MPRAASNVSEIDGRPGSQRHIVFAQDDEIADAIDFIIVAHAPVTIAKADFRPNVKTDFRSTLFNPAMKGAAFRPCVDGKRPADRAPAGLLRRSVRGQSRGQARTTENQGGRQNQENGTGKSPDQPIHCRSSALTYDRPLFSSKAGRRWRAPHPSAQEYAVRYWRDRRCKCNRARRFPHCWSESRPCSGLVRRS